MMLTFPRFLLHTANLLWIVHTVPTTAQVVVIPTPTPTGSPAQNTTTVSPTPPVSTIAPTHSPSTIAPVNNVTVVPLDITNAPTPPFTSQPTDTTNATTTTSSIGFDNTTSTAPMSTSDQPSQSPTVRTGTAITTGSDSPSLSPLDQRSTNPSSSPTDPMEVEPNIINGELADYGEYPFYAWAPDSGLCGGTLIHDDIILTAAHCGCALFEYSDIFIGGIEMNGDNSVDQFLFFNSEGVIRCYAHENFDPYFFDDDIMLLKLNRRSTAEVVKLNFDASIPQTNDIVVSIGYGLTSYELQTDSAQLLELSSEIISEEDCDDAFPRGPINPTPPPLEINPDYDPEKNICSLNPEGATCQGDSGGPLLTTQGVQIGITSYGPKGCGEIAVRPNVVTEVAAYEDWIKDNICALTSYCPDYCAFCNEPTPPPTYPPTNPPIDEGGCDTYGKGKGGKGKGGTMTKCNMGKKTPKEPKTPKVEGKKKDKYKMDKKGKMYKRRY